VSFSKEGRPAVPARFMLGMLILKSMANRSDEELFTRWPRDPYYPYFTEELYFQHQVPYARSGLSHTGVDALGTLGASASGSPPAGEPAL
jgi:hypothetical protein